MDIQGTQASSFSAGQMQKVASMKTENQAPQQAQDMSGAAMPQQAPAESGGIDTLA